MAGSKLPSLLSMSLPAVAEAEMSVKSSSHFMWPSVLWKKSVSMSLLGSWGALDGIADELTLTWKSGPFSRKSSVKVAGKSCSGGANISV